MPKVNRKLTEKEINTAQGKDKPYRLYDTDGLTIIVRPTGTKAWQYRYKLNGSTNTYTIGTVGTIKSSKAREKCQEVKKLIQKGINPNQQKKSEIQTNVEEGKNTFQAIAEDWYAKQTWTEKHAKNIKSRLEKDAFPIIGHKPITDITSRDIIAILRKIESRGAMDVAQRVCNYCSQIFDYALIQDLCENNPALGRAKFVNRPKVQHRKHLVEKELPKFIKKLNKVDPTKMNLAVKLLLLTFVRPGELRQAKWEDINLKGAKWIIPAECMKMGREHIVPLSKQAIEALKELQKITGHSPLLFPGQKRAIQPVSDVALIKKVKELTNEKSVPHGFRHTASTILNENNFPPDHIEMQLSHVEENKVRGTYNKAQYLPQRKEMMQYWADYLDKKGK